MLKTYDGLLNLEATITKDLFNEVNHPWEVLPLINEFILNIIPLLGDEYIDYGDNVFVHKNAKVEESACIKGPTIICNCAEIRHCAYIRGNVIVGENSVIGNSTEVKNAIIFNNVQCPHFNYVGDSVLGEFAHIGCGVVCSNVKSDKKDIKVTIDENIIDTRLRKFGVILGDRVEVGCNSVLCPGTIVFPNTNIYPLTMVRGIIEKDKIVKNMDDIVDKI